MKKTLLILIAALLIAGGAYYYFTGDTDKVTYLTETVTSDNLKKSVITSVTVRA